MHHPSMRRPRFPGAYMHAFGKLSRPLMTSNWTMTTGMLAFQPAVVSVVSLSCVLGLMDLALSGAILHHTSQDMYHTSQVSSWTKTDHASVHSLLQLRHSAPKSHVFCVHRVLQRSTRCNGTLWLFRVGGLYKGCSHGANTKFNRALTLPWVCQRSVNIATRLKAYNSNPPPRLTLI